MREGVYVGCGRRGLRGFAGAQVGGRVQLGCSMVKLQMRNVVGGGTGVTGSVLRGLCVADTVPWLDTHLSVGYSPRSGG